MFTARIHVNMAVDYDACEEEIIHLIMAAIIPTMKEKGKGRIGETRRMFYDVQRILVPVAGIIPTSTITLTLLDVVE